MAPRDPPAVGPLRPNSPSGFGPRHDVAHDGVGEVDAQCWKSESKHLGLGGGLLLPCAELFGLSNVLPFWVWYGLCLRVLRREPEKELHWRVEVGSRDAYMITIVVRPS